MYNSLIDKVELEKAAREGLNVLFTGRKGVGKTHVGLEILEAAGYKVKYFSGANIEPYLDFVGIPKEYPEENIFRMLLPEWHTQGYDALFIDELGRNRPAVNNALFEIIQFRKMHGKDTGIKVVWAATNPHDDTEESYDVQPLDPALKDRFHIHYEVPYDVDELYFNTKYESLGDAAVEFWRKNCTDAQRLDFSPRRLDVAVQMFLKGFDLTHVLPNTQKGAINPAQFISKLEEKLPIKSKLQQFFTSGDKEKAKKFLAVDNNYNNALPLIVENQEFIDFFIPLISNERLVSIATSNLEVAKHVVTNPYPASVKKCLETLDGEFHRLHVASCIASVAETEETGSYEVSLLPSNLPKVKSVAGFEASFAKESLPQEKIKLLASLVKSFPEKLDSVTETTEIFDRLIETCTQLNFTENFNTKPLVFLSNILFSKLREHGVSLNFSKELLSTDAKVEKKAEIKCALSVLTMKEVFKGLIEASE